MAIRFDQLVARPRDETVRITLVVNNRIGSKCSVVVVHQLINLLLKENATAANEPAEFARSQSISGKTKRVSATHISNLPHVCLREAARHRSWADWPRERRTFRQHQMPRNERDPDGRQQQRGEYDAFGGATFYRGSVG